MRVLWLVNFPPIKVAEENGLPKMVNEGWISGMSTALSKMNDIELYMCYSQKVSKKIMLSKLNGIKYIGYFDEEPEKVNWELENVFARILSKVNPDVIHIMGTEYPHALMMIRTCKQCGVINHCVVSIQGLISYCARYIEAELPAIIKYAETPYSILTRNSVHLIRRNYEKRGIYEKQALKEVKNVIGRTDWDRACVNQLNANAKYYFNNEVLRTSFYSGKKWNVNECERYTIFVSQATYPLKGFHVMLEAFAEILKEFPTAVLKVAGYNRLMFKKSILKRTPYEMYLLSIIDKYNVSVKSSAYR